MRNRWRSRCLVLVVLSLLALMLTGTALAADLAFEQEKITIFEGKRQYLKVVQTGGAVGEEITWKSSNERVATVNEKGLLVAVNKGQVTITASCRSGSRTVRATCNVTVQRAVQELIIDERELLILPADDMDLEGLMTLEAPDGEEPYPVLVCQTGKTIGLRYSVQPEGASSNKITITSSDPEVAKQNGNYNAIRVLAPGESIVTIASELNPEVAVTYHLLAIDAKQTVKQLKVSADKQTIGVGLSAQIEAVVTPDTAYLPGVTYVSLNENILTVDAFGRVTGVGRGQTSVRVMAKDGSGVYRNIQFTVQQQPTAIEVDSQLVCAVGMGNRQIKATVLPQNANNKRLTYTSSNPNVAKVNGNGYVTPVKAGTCVVTVASELDPSVRAEVTVTVNQPVKKITFEERVITVNVNETVWVSWNTAPEDATDPSVELSSNNTKIFTVTQSGQIRGVSRGEATLTVRATDGGNARATIKVQVLQPVWGVHVNREIEAVDVDEETQVSVVIEPTNANNKRMSWSSADTSIATVRGTYNTVTIIGHRWGDVVITGVTEDGGYSCSFIARVGSYNKALTITDFYTQENRIKINVRNNSNLEITRFYFTIEAYDIYDNPLAITASGSNMMEARYVYGSLMPGQMTEHGRFTFADDFVQPTEIIGRMVMRIYAYHTSEGMYWEIKKEQNRPAYQFTSPLFVGPQLDLPPINEMEELTKRR